jgi:hypothetical protein
MGNIKRVGSFAQHGRSWSQMDSSSSNSQHAKSVSSFSLSFARPFSQVLFSRSPISGLYLALSRIATVALHLTSPKTVSLVTSALQARVPAAAQRHRFPLCGRRLLRRSLQAVSQRVARSMPPLQPIASSRSFHQSRVTLLLKIVHLDVIADF